MRRLYVIDCDLCVIGPDIPLDLGDHITARRLVGFALNDHPLPGPISPGQSRNRHRVASVLHGSFAEHLPGQSLSDWFVISNDQVGGLSLFAGGGVIGDLDPRASPGRIWLGPNGGSCVVGVKVQT